MYITLIYYAMKNACYEYIKLYSSGSFIQYSTPTLHMYIFSNKSIVKTTILFLQFIPITLQRGSFTRGPAHRPAH